MIQKQVCSANIKILREMRGICVMHCTLRYTLIIEKSTFWKKKLPVLWSETSHAEGSLIDCNYCATSDPHKQQGSKRLPREQPLHFTTQV